MNKLTMLGIGHPFVGDFSSEIIQGIIILCILINLSYYMLTIMMFLLAV